MKESKILFLLDKNDLYVLTNVDNGFSLEFTCI